MRKKTSTKIKRTKAHTAFLVFAYILITFLALICLYPFWYVACASFSDSITLNAHVGLCNSYIEQKQPWALAKDETKLPELHRVLAHLLECCAQVGYLLGCILPEASARILSQLQLDLTGLTPQNMAWGLVKDGHEVQAPSPVFPRILSAEEKEKMAAKAAKAAEKAARKAAQQG